MSETISLEWIGATLRAIQAEQRTLRMENELIRKELGQLAGAMVTRDLLSEVLRIIVDRIGNFEAYVDTRLDQQRAYLDTRLDRLESLIAGQRP